MTFRSKLLLSMFFIIGGISIAIIWITKSRIETEYNRVLRQQFEQQMALFREKQELRARATRDIVRIVAKDPILADDIEAGDYRKFYRDLETDLGKFALLRLERDHWFFRFIDQSGKVIPPVEENHGGQVVGWTESELDQNLVSIASTESGNPEEKAGYFHADSLYEVIVTPVHHPTTNAFLGELVYGELVSDLEDVTGGGHKEVRSGLLVDLNLKTSFDLLPHETEQLTDHVGEHGETEKVWDIGGTSHLVFSTSVGHDSFPPAYHVSLYSLEKMGDLLVKIWETIVTISGLAFVISVLLCLGIAHGLSRPVKRLVHGTEAIREGELNHRVNVRSKDEIGQLGHAFNHMADGLELKDKYRSVLDKVSDKSIVDELVAGKLELGGEVRVATVLFCDIRGFTSLTEGMPPGEVIELLNEHMTILTKIVTKYNGAVDKYVGDEIMVLFGAPQSFGEDARNATRCALEMVEAREAANASSDREIRIGIGLSTGEVVAGCMGSEERLNYTVLGEQVNLAARLCGSAGPGEVLIDDVTREALGPHAEADESIGLQLKGFSAEKKAYRIRSVGP